MRKYSNKIAEDERSIANRLAAEEVSWAAALGYPLYTNAKQQRSEPDDDLETAQSKKDPTLPVSPIEIWLRRQKKSKKLTATRLALTATNLPRAQKSMLNSRLKRKRSWSARARLNCNNRYFRYSRFVAGKWLGKDELTIELKAETWLYIAYVNMRWPCGHTEA